MFFMPLPETFLGVWNLIGISQQRTLSSMSPAWLQAHGQRILPAFCGMRALWSTRLMFWSRLLLHVGCALRVALEPLAYESYWNFAWKLLPYSP